MLCLENITYKVPNRILVDKVSAKLKPGTVTAVMGSNGAGKSTLLKIISGEINTFKGNILWNKENMKNISLKKLAKCRAVLKQQYSINLPFNVYDIIEMGRYPHFNNKPSNYCKEVIKYVSEYVGVHNLLTRNYLTLSGGEQQRVQLARVLAQVWDAPEEKRLIMLDEPVNALDIKYQHHLLDLVNNLSKNGFMVIAVLHDLNLAAQYADDILFLKKGQKVAFGTKNEILNENYINDTFDISVALHKPQDNEFPYIMVNPVKSTIQVSEC